jgi:hypothetical protein
MKGYEVIVSFFIEADSADQAEKAVLNVLNNSLDVNLNSVVAQVLESDCPPLMSKSGLHGNS